LAGYHNNVRKSRDTAESYVDTGLLIDSTNNQLKGIKEIFNKQKNQKSGGKAAGSSKPASSIRKPSNNS